MQQVDVERSQEFRKCIECFLCQNVCHVIRDHEDNKVEFSGPRFFIRAAELDMHPLDARSDRKDMAVEEQGIGYCNITKCCTEVCPEHIKITDNAIIPMKERAVDRRYDPIAWLGSKIFRRDQLDKPAGYATAGAGAPRSNAGTASSPVEHAAAAGAQGDISMNWHREAPAGHAAPIGPDGKLPVTEFTGELAGAQSPFGDDVSFPMPLSDINSQHPAHPDEH
jgi:succinate dehydrogenase / fumarate reductase iron-sulfur subunit